MDTKNLRLLVLDDSPNEAESYATIFRNAGYATRLHRITSAEDAELVLDQTWDLIIAAPHTENYEPIDLLALIKTKKVDIPYIQLLDNDLVLDPHTVADYLARGAKDVLCIEPKPTNLILVAKRELASLVSRRQLARIEKALAESERRCHILLDSSKDAIAYIHDGMHIYLNQSYANMFGYKDRADIEALPIIDLISADNPSDLKDLFKHRIESTLSCFGIKNGHKFPIIITTYPASYDGEDCMQVVISNQSSVESDALKQKIKEISKLDTLTQLYNRAYLSDVLSDVMENVRKENTHAVLAYIRIDNFDSLSAQIGIGGTDSLLISIANIFKQHFKPDDILARLSDDAFVVLTYSLDKEFVESLKELQEKIIQELFDVSDFSVQITISAGVSSFNQELCNPQEVIDRAYRSLESIKETNNSIKIYDPAEALAKAASQGDLLATLQHTLNKELLKLLYQPIVSLRGKAFEFYEVRLRMYDNENKELPLTKLLEVASLNGLAEQIDRWVIVNALKEVAKMRATGNKPRVFVQVGSDTLKNDTLLDWLKKLFVATKLPPECLIVEFTESDAATYLKQAQTLINGLNEMGCQTVISDFGKDNNSLLTLNHLSTSFVKVSPTLVQALRKPEGVEELTNLLNKLNAEKRKTIVPFVESASILSVLWQAGADYIQGYYLQKPTSAMSYDFSSGQ